MVGSTSFQDGGRRLLYVPAHPASAGRLVHSDDAPTVTHAGAVDPVDAGKRAILGRMVRIDRDRGTPRDATPPRR